MDLAIDIHILAYLLNSFFGLFFNERVLTLFFGKRKTSLPVMALHLVGNSAVVGFVFLFFNIPWLTMLTSLTGLFTLSFHYDASLVKRFSGVLGGWLTLIILETAVIGIFNYQFSMVTSVDETSALTTIGIGVGIYVATILLNQFKNIRANPTTSKRAHMLYLSVPAISFVMLWISPYLPPNITPFFIVGLFLMNLIFFYFLDQAALAETEKKKGWLARQEKDYYLAQNELMVDTVETVKGMRHDMKLHLAALKDYTATNPAEAMAYIDYLVADLGKSEIYSDTGNAALDSIVNYKLKDAKDDGVQVDSKIFAPPCLALIRQILWSSLEICSVTLWKLLARSKINLSTFTSFIRRKPC